MSARFFIEDKLKAGTLAFDGTEFHHMVRVTRHQIGDTVRLFDGAGKEADAEITFISRHSATLKVGKIETIPQEPGPHLVLAVAMPKLTRAGWLVEKAVELGVSRIIPIQTQRSVVDPRESRLDALRNTIVAASKQCGRSRLMEVTSVMNWQDFVNKVVPNYSTTVAHPGGMPFTSELVATTLTEAAERHADDKKVAEDSLLVVIGPEGGFVIEEVTQATARGARLVSLGSRILRMETAAIYAAVVFNSSLSR